MVSPGPHCLTYFAFTKHQDVMFSGRKWTEKVYRKHSGYPGGFSETLAKDVHAKDDTMVRNPCVYG